MQDAEHNHSVAFNPEKEFVREAMCQDAAKSAIVERKTFWIGLKADQRFSHGGKRFIAQSAAPLLIPIMCLLKIRPGGSADGNTPAYWRDRRTW